MRTNLIQCFFIEIGSNHTFLIDYQYKLHHQIVHILLTEYSFIFGSLGKILWKISEYRKNSLSKQATALATRGKILIGNITDARVVCCFFPNRRFTSEENEMTFLQCLISIYIYIYILPPLSSDWLLNSHQRSFHGEFSRFPVRERVTGCYKGFSRAENSLQVCSQNSNVQRAM